MSYQNPYSTGYQVQKQLHCSDCPSGDYNINAHGDIGAHYNSMANADLPKYTLMFYRPTMHEQLADLRYAKIDVNYDDGSREMLDAIRGPPISAYIPRALSVDGGSASPSFSIKDAEVLPKRTIIDEILRAQAEILGKKPVSPEMFILRQIEISEEIHMKRTLRKVEIIKKSEQ
jgi:hypothetical protein